MPAREASVSGFEVPMRICLILCVLLTIAGHARAADLIRTVAATGQPAPGTLAGNTFQEFPDAFNLGPPALNNAGQTAFVATVFGPGYATDPTHRVANTSGLWSEGHGALRLVARSGTPAPGLQPTDVFDTFDSLGTDGSRYHYLQLNDAGHVAFNSRFRHSAGAQQFEGIWSDRSGALQLVAREMSSIDRQPQPYPFWMFNNQFSFNAQSAVTISGTALIPSPDGGLFHEVDGSFEPVALIGGPAPGLSEGATFSELGRRVGSTNSSGAIAFVGTANSSAGTSEGVWRRHKGQLELLAHFTTPVPDAPASVRFLSIESLAPTIDDGGDVAFAAKLTGTSGLFDFGIWARRGDVLRTVYRAGSSVPGGPATALFVSPFPAEGRGYSPSMDAAGNVTFRADYVEQINGGTRITGIWQEGDEGLALVARAGMQAPGFDEGVILKAPASPIVNRRGQVAFLAGLSGPEFPQLSFNSSIWVHDELGLRSLAHEGGPLEVAPGDIRTISKLSFGLGGENAFSSGFNDRGQLAFYAGFTDGTSGIFVSSDAAAPTADFDWDGYVDGADLLAWQLGLGKIDALPGDGDANYDGIVDAADLTIWQSQSQPSEVSSVPEPASAMMILAAAMLPAAGARRFAKSAR